MKRLLNFIIIVFLFAAAFYFINNKSPANPQSNLTDTPNLQDEGEDINQQFPPLSIEGLKNGEYPGSEIIIEQKLDAGGNYDRYITSYKSEGLKIYALLTVPQGEKPKKGWPAIIFNHGYIPPAEYRTTERYIAYTDGFSRNGYIVFRPDYRGHGNSEGEASGAYGSNAYTIDVLNAVSSIKKLKDPLYVSRKAGSTSGGNSQMSIVNPERIGMWGHSLGGFITLRSMVVSKDIKAGVIWAGVVASYSDLLRNWRRGPTRPIPTGSRSWRQLLVQQFGEPEENPEFWNSISATSYLADISGPLQLHHGTGDYSVPVAFSEKLASLIKESGKSAELYTYPGDDHNLSGNFNTAMERSIEFFDRYLKKK